MSTNARDELARIIDEHEWSRHLGGSRGEQIADILIEHGWRKVDPAADTRTEWGVRYDDTGDLVYHGRAVRTEEQAQCIVSDYGDGAVAMSRTVTYGPWREVEQ